MLKKRGFKCVYCRCSFDDRQSLTAHKYGCQERIRALDSLQRRRIREGYGVKKAC